LGKSIQGAETLTIGKAFKSFYVVPPFQREYVWTARKQVKRLLEDLAEAFHSGTSEGAYFVGSTVVYRAEDEDTFNLVDGQQRMTTLYILVAAVRDRFLELDPEKKVQFLESAIWGTYPMPGGEEGQKHRVQLQYPELSRVLESLGNRRAHELKLKKNDTGFELMEAYRFCRKFLAEQFGDDGSDLGDFAYFVLNNVELITIETQDLPSALTIFETINDTGVGLNAMDLLKNLLFREVKSANERAELRQEWKDLLATLRKGGERSPIRFLKYFLISSYEFESMPTANLIFRWIRDHRTELGYGKSPLRFVRKMQDAAAAYVAFFQGFDANGKVNPFLMGIVYQKTRVRQHLPLLLAARHLKKADFHEFCRWIENLVFVYAATDVQWNRIESAAPTWCNKLREIETPEDLEKFIQANLRKAIRERSGQVVEVLERMDGLGINLQKYVLASLTQRVEEECGKGGSLDYYFEGTLSVEHIFPQSPKEEVIEQFRPRQENEFYIYRLGNHVLLHRNVNSAASNRGFDKKKRMYEVSTYDLTRSLVKDIRMGKNNKIIQTVEKYELTPYRSWNPDNLEKRHRAMLKIAADVWGLARDAPAPERLRAVQSTSP
jgi:hypothetical protein